MEQSIEMQEINRLIGEVESLTAIANKVEYRDELKGRDGFIKMIDKIDAAKLAMLKLHRRFTLSIFLIDRIMDVDSLASDARERLFGLDDYNRSVNSPFGLEQ